MGPMSGDRADRLASRLAAAGPATVADYGCGWGELLLRVLERCPQARGTGIDVYAPDIERARRNAAGRGLADRATFVAGSAADHAASVDVAVSIGAFHAFGTVTEALAALAERTNPGGRLLFGAEFWVRPPTPSELATMWPDASADDCVDLATLAGQAVAAGFRLLSVETASLNEWEEFEFGLTRDSEEWILANPDHPQAAEVITRVDGQHRQHLGSTRDVLGLAYLTLGRRG